MRRLILILPALLVAACAAGTPATSGAPSATPAGSSAPSDSAGPNILPIFISSEIIAGRNRFLFSLTDAANKLVAAPTVPVKLEFFDVAADEQKVVSTADARFIWAVPDLKGLYAADVEFPTPGR